VTHDRTARLARRALRTLATAIVVAAAIPAAVTAQSDRGGTVPTGVPPVTPTPGASAFNGNGMWIWVLPRTYGGNIAKITAKARANNIGTLFIKSGDLPKTLTQSGRRFWATVDTVASPADATLLRNANVYDLRSAAAHGERMPGLETLYGPVVVPPFLVNGEPDSVGEFVHQTVRILGDVSRSALLRVFGGSP